MCIRAPAFQTIVMSLSNGAIGGIVAGCAAFGLAIAVYWRIQQARSMGKVPTRMRVVHLVNFIANENDIKSAFRVDEIDVPPLRPGEVLVRVEASPINPSDVSSMAGTYGGAPSKSSSAKDSKEAQGSGLPVQLGLEGSGQVVATGGGLLGGLVLGKRVACVSPRSGGRLWAEYAVVPALQCLPLPSNVSYIAGCSAFVNPLTVLGFLDIAKVGGHRAILHTAAASALGKMLVRLGHRRGIKIVCVVRKESQVEELKALGAEYIVNTSVEGWESQLQQMCAKLKCRLGFECVGGSLTGQVMTSMPARSELYIYGGLALQPIDSLHIRNFIFDDKVIKGFWLSIYLKDKSIFFLRSLTNQVASLIASDLSTYVRASFDLEHTSDALLLYKSDMGAGKSVIAPQQKLGRTDYLRVNAKD